MDDISKKCCPNCSQKYTLKQQSPTSKSNFPLFLQCGHSMCENCIRNIVKYSEPVECKVCQQDTTVAASDIALLHNDREKLYKLFSINYIMLGELAASFNDASNECSIDKQDCFVDLRAILKDGDTKNAKCVECQRPTKNMCQQCDNILCETCFMMSHNKFVVFKNHELKDIDAVVSPAICKVHKLKPLDYFCKDCNQCKCMDCLIIGGEKSCKKHNIVSMQEVNTSFLAEIGQLGPKAMEMFKRLTKTAYDVGHILSNMDNNKSPSELSQIIDNIEQHFSKLCANLQKHKHEVLRVVNKLIVAEKESVHKAMEDLTESIKKGKKVIDKIAMTSDEKKIKQLNLALLVEDAKELADSAWYLTRDETTDSLKVAVNEDLCGLISEYLHLEGTASSAYRLCKTADIKKGVEIPPPPAALVFAPLRPEDVRQTKNKQAKPKDQPREEQKNGSPIFYANPPQFRSKRGSVRCLDSVTSDSSQRSYLQPQARNRPDIPQFKSNVQPVHPFAEPEQVQPLLQGTQELMYISHIVSPHDFYVQRASHQPLVKEMIRHLQKENTAIPSPKHVSEDKMYLAYNESDKMWQRCRVLKVDKSNPDKFLFDVFFFDFGSSDLVDIENLRHIPPRAALTPPLAINCALANCVPNSGAWKNEDAFLVHKIANNKQVVIHVRRVLQLGNGAVKLECDVITYEDGTSVAHALLFHERAKMPEPWLKYPQHQGIREKARIFLNSDNHDTRGVEEVCISHAVSPDKFFVRKKYQQKLYEELGLELEQTYNLNSTTGTICLPEIGMSCCVHVPAQASGVGGAFSAGGWERAVVTALPGRGRVQLALVDAGAAHVGHWSTLRYLHPRFTRLSSLATECHLAGVSPCSGSWSAGAVALMHHYSQSYLHMQVEERRSKGSLAVSLTDNMDPDNPVCINQEMVKQRFAITFGIFTFNKGEDLSEQGMSYPPPLRTTLKRNTTEPQEDLEAKDMEPLKVEAQVLQYKSPSLIYVAITQRQETFNELYDEMQNYYSKHEPINKEKWEVGDRCCTICIQSKTWRRALIVQIDGDDAKVFYSDFACVETIPIAKLAELTPDFASIGDAAIKCHLVGVVSSMGEQWPSLTKEYLGDLLEAYNRIYITQIGSFKDKSMPVEIWVYHTIRGGALEPNRWEWRSLSKKIIDQGLGVPDTSEEYLAVTSEANPEAKEDMLSFFQLTGNIKDWLQLEPTPTKPLPRSDSPYSDILTSSDEHTEDMDSSNVLLISDWLPQKPLAAKEFTAMPTHIDDDGVIYLHDVRQHDTLDLICMALDLRFEKPDPRAPYYKWAAGEPCVALYHLDGRFYRGRVLKVDEEASSCLVRYIDYGNVEACSFVNMRRSVPLHEVPTQAHRCVLHRVRPVGDKWERRSLDYMQRFIVEKNCLVKVTGDSVDGLTPVTLSVDEICVDDHLVEFDMAIYADRCRNIAVAVSDSDPDHIIEDEPKGDAYIKYSEELEEEFLCTMTYFEDKDNLELGIVHDDETAALYVELMKELQTEGESRPPVTHDGILLNKACIALCPHDKQWYRAALKEASESRGKVKVRFVDYGHSEVLDLTDVREIHPEWAKLAPGSVTVRLHAVKVNSELDVNTIAEEYKETFLDESMQPFKVKVIKTDEYPFVEIRDKTDELVYKNLFEKGIYQEFEE